MDAKKKDRFFKEFIARETKEGILELHEILEKSSDTNNRQLKELIRLFLQQSDKVDDDSTIKNNNISIRSHDVIHIIQEVLKNKLDFNNRLHGNKNIL